jgi:hypothetical protein
VITLYHWFGQAMPGYFMTPSSCWDARTLCRPSNGPVHQIHLLMKRGPRVGRWRGHWPSTTDPLQVPAHQQETGHEAVGQTLQKIHGDGAEGVFVWGEVLRATKGKRMKKGRSININQYQSISIKSINIIQSCFCLSSTPSSINAKGKRHPTLVTPEQLTTGAGLMLQFSQEPGEMDPSSPSKPRQSQAHRCSQGCARCSEWKYEWT